MTQRSLYKLLSAQALGNIGFYFETTKNDRLYKKQEHTLINHPFTFEYNLITNESSIDLTELPSI